MFSVPTQTVLDQMGRTVTVAARPQRIVSLVPSQTELLLDLGVGERLVGRTRFCVHPADQVRRVSIVGGTKQVNLAAVERLQPDLIIANKEENDRETILRLAERYPVWLSDVVTLDDALAMIRQVGRLVGEAERADALAAEVAMQLAAVPRLQTPRRVAYLIWQKPWMAAGSNTFINSMLAHCGLVNVLAGPEHGRYPQVTLEALAAAQPDLVFLSSEPYPFREQHRAALQAALPASTVMLVDGEMFSWYGSRLRLAAGYLVQLMAEIAVLQR